MPNYATRAQRESVEGLLAAADALGHTIGVCGPHPGETTLMVIAINHDNEPMIWDVDSDGTRWVRED